MNTPDRLENRYCGTTANIGLSFTPGNGTTIDIGGGEEITGNLSYNLNRQTYHANVGMNLGVFDAVNPAGNRSILDDMNLGVTFGSNGNPAAPQVRKMQSGQM